MRERSRISVRQTTSESILKPLPARIPDTRERTPGSFWTKQFRMCLELKNRSTVPASVNCVRVCDAYFLKGCRLGGGVL